MIIRVICVEYYNDGFAWGFDRDGISYGISYDVDLSSYSISECVTWKI